MDFNLNDPLDEEYEIESFQNLLHIEAEFMASEHYHENPPAVVGRKKATAFILERYSAGTLYNPKEIFIPLVALTYFDRFFSRQPLQADTMLIAFSCLSLAWKMRRTKFYLGRFRLLASPNSINFQVVEVERMELHILSTLNWRMRSITALNFLDSFISLLNMDNPQSQTNLKIGAANNFVKKMYSDIQFTQFKPSIIAASALVFQSISSGPHSDLRVAFAPFIDRDELHRCIKQIATLDMISAVPTSIPVQQHPIMNEPVDPPSSSYPRNHDDDDDDDDDEKEPKMRKLDELYK